jgi:hypothetical protein
MRPVGASDSPPSARESAAFDVTWLPIDTNIHSLFPFNLTSSHSKVSLSLQDFHPGIQTTQNPSKPAISSARPTFRHGIQPPISRPHNERSRRMIPTLSHNCTQTNAVVISQHSTPAPTAPPNSRKRSMISSPNSTPSSAPSAANCYRRVSHTN